MTPHGTAWLLAASIAAVATALSASIAMGGPPATRPATPPPEPTPQLTPEQVVKVVLAGLKSNDATDGGIRIAFAFASPGNQAVTGPIERFIPLVKNPLYAPLLNHRSATVRELAVKDGEAAELVTLVDSAGHPAFYLFTLSKHPDAGKLKDCWLTDGVTRVEPKESKLQA